MQLGGIKDHCRKETILEDGERGFSLEKKSSIAMELMSKLFLRSINSLCKYCRLFHGFGNQIYVRKVNIVASNWFIGNCNIA